VPSQPGWGPTEAGDGNLFRNAERIASPTCLSFCSRGTPVSSYESPHRDDGSVAMCPVVAMTFIPLLGYYIQGHRKGTEPPVREKRQRGFYCFTIVGLVGPFSTGVVWVLARFLSFLLIGGSRASHLKQQFLS